MVRLEDRISAELKRYRSPTIKCLSQLVFFYWNPIFFICYLMHSWPLSPIRHYNIFLNVSVATTIFNHKKLMHNYTDINVYVRTYNNFMTKRFRNTITCLATQLICTLLCVLLSYADSHLQPQLNSCSQKRLVARKNIYLMPSTTMVIKTNKEQLGHIWWT